MIHDGECSWKSITSLDCRALLVIYNPNITEENLHLQSLVANFGSQQHTHREIINAVYEEHKIKGRKLVDIALACRRKPSWAENYNRLHNLHPELQVLLGEPTPKKDRIPWILDLDLAGESQDKQLAHYAEVKGMLPKVAHRALQVYKRQDEESVVVRKKKPSDDVRIIERILTTTQGEVTFLLSLDSTVFGSDSFDKLMSAAKIEVIVAQLQTFYVRAFGRELTKPDPLATAKLGAKRFEGLHREPIRGVGDLIDGNRGRTSPQVS